jgi:hypothetical protein
MSAMTKAKYGVAVLGIILLLAAVFVLMPLRKALADTVTGDCTCIRVWGIPIICLPCLDVYGCVDDDCDEAVEAIQDDHEEYRDRMLTEDDNDADCDDHPDDHDCDDNEQNLTQQFRDQIVWDEMVYFRQLILPALMKYTEQMSAIGMQQIFIVGQFFDAKHQMETQRLLLELQAQAHKDYHPSEDFCWFGTNVRSLANSEETARVNSMVLNANHMSRQLGKEESASAASEQADKASRWQRFTSTYCDPQDAGWYATEPNSGLRLACGTGGGDTARINLDVDYTRAIEEPRTLDVRFTDTTTTNTERDLIALSENIFGHQVLTRNINEDYLRQEPYQHLYLGLRAVAAKRNVAQNSFDAIIGMKSKGSSDTNGIPASQTREYLGAVLSELGMPDDEIYEIIGTEPSYYAQLEILAKKIYQNPDFYANLYDQPANVARKSVALKAIELMLDRAIYESQVRREMATSVLLSTKLQQKFKSATLRSSQ